MKMYVRASNSNIVYVAYYNDVPLDGIDYHTSYDAIQALRNALESVIQESGIDDIDFNECYVSKLNKATGVFEGDIYNASNDNEFIKLIRKKSKGMGIYKLSDSSNMIDPRFRLR